MSIEIPKGEASIENLVFHINHNNPEYSHISSIFSSEVRLALMYLGDFENINNECMTFAMRACDNEPVTKRFDRSIEGLRIYGYSDEHPKGIFSADIIHFNDKKDIQAIKADLDEIEYS